MKLLSICNVQKAGNKLETKVEMIFNLKLLRVQKSSTSETETSDFKTNLKQVLQIYFFLCFYRSIRSFEATSSLALF